jgi:5-methylcytosine-specific restriction endonuclease McrA
MWWRNCTPPKVLTRLSSIVSTYSYTQLSQYLSCPRRYRYRYIDGWQEKETRAGMLFGRTFETAIGALFRREDCGQVLFDNWSGYRNVCLDYSRGDTWDSMLHQGIHLLERFAQDDRVRIRNPRSNLQVKSTRSVSTGNDFVAYIDAIGELDHKYSIIDWKTSSARYPDQPAGLLALDPQLVCYSWVTGEPEVAFVVFVRKRPPEVQYLRTTITDDQRQQFGELVEKTIGRIERLRQVPRLLPGDDLRGLPGGSAPRGRQSRCHAQSRRQTVAIVTHWATGNRDVGIRQERVRSISKDRPIRLSLEEYRALHRAMLERDRWKCQACGSIAGVEVHHIRHLGRSGSDSVENLICLCRNCHSKVHMRP